MTYFMNTLNELEKMLDSVVGPEMGYFSDIKVNITEKDDRYILEAGIPGLEKEDIDIHVDQNLLKIQVSPKEGEEEVRYLIRERRRNRMERSFILPKDADKEAITADLKNGLLTVSIQKLEKEERRTIEIR